MQKMKKAVSWILKVISSAVLCILVGLFVIILGYVVSLKVQQARGIYKTPKFSAYMIVSPSMHPAIKVYDAILVMDVEPKGIKKGDVITFNSSDAKTGGIIITHRVIAVIKNSDGEYLYRTKGDNNQTPDPTYVRENNVIGKVLFKIPKIGYVQTLVSTSYGWLLIVVVPCFGIIIYDILKLFKVVGKKKKGVEG